MKRIAILTGLLAVLSGFLCGCNSGDADSDAVACYDLGVVHANAGRHVEAIREFEKAVAIKPDFVDAYYNMGVAYGKLGRYAEALAPYTKVIAINPDYTDAYHNRAVAHYFTHNYDKAWDDVKACQKLGDEVHPGFLAELRKASGRKE